jgi:hypothetical protein
MDADTRYFAARRRGEDATRRRQAAAAALCEAEIEAGTKAGLRPYTQAWAEWSERWHADREANISYPAK